MKTRRRTSKDTFLRRVEMEKGSATNYWRRLDSLALARCGLGRSSVDGYHSNKGRGQTGAVDPLSRASFIWSMRVSSISSGKSSRSPSSGPQGVLSALGRRRSALRRRTALESSRAYNGVAAATRAWVSSREKLAPAYGVSTANEC